MMLKRCAAVVAAVAGCALAVSAHAASAAPRTGAAVPRGLAPVASSWISTQRGIALAYPAPTSGAKPYLFVTANAGRTWRTLPPPPVRYPVDNDQPDAVWADGVIMVTDGTHIVATRDSGRHWSAVRLAGASGVTFVRIAITDGRVFALVQTRHGSTFTVAVYSGPTTSGVLRAVRGMAVSGSLVYGDVSTAGGLQIDLGADFARERYWYSRDGARFMSAPLPCPVATPALLGGAHAGGVTALCNGSASDVSPGQNDKQVWVATRLGGTFTPSGPVFVSANEQRFATATMKNMTLATNFTLAVTGNAGHTWATKITEGNGAWWTDLSFQSSTTGIVVVTTINNALKLVGFIYRTTDAARSWHPLSLP